MMYPTDTELIIEKGGKKKFGRRREKRGEGSVLSRYRG